jgi:hypothetical protein
MRKIRKPTFSDFFLTPVFGRFEAHFGPEIPLKPALALAFLSI